MANWDYKKAQIKACLIEAETTAPNGKTVRMHRFFDGSGDVYKAALASISKRKDNGAKFYGCTVFIHTPLHNFELILECRYGDLVFQSTRVGEFGTFANMQELEQLVNDC